MSSQESISFLVQVASNDLEIGEQWLPEPQENDAYEKLLSTIKLRIEELIDSDFERLLYLLYRSDVSEKKLRQALDESPSDEASNIIARMFIERQLEKYETRMRFSESQGEGSWEDDL